MREPSSEILLYQAETGETRIEVRLLDETVWLTQAQMAELFDRDVRTINEHIGNIYDEAECEEAATLRKFRIVRMEGSREVSREVAHYNLDVIISVGYRAKSHRGVPYRLGVDLRYQRLSKMCCDPICKPAIATIGDIGVDRHRYRQFSFRNGIGVTAEDFGGDPLARFAGGSESSFAG